MAEISDRHSSNSGGSTQERRLVAMSVELMGCNVEWKNKKYDIFILVRYGVFIQKNLQKNDLFHY